MLDWQWQTELTLQAALIQNIPDGLIWADVCRTDTWSETFRDEKHTHTQTQQHREAAALHACANPVYTAMHLVGNTLWIIVQIFSGSTTGSIHYPSTPLSIHYFTNPSICLLCYLSINVLIYPSICPRITIPPLIYASINSYLFSHPFLHESIQSHLSISILLLIHWSIHPPVHSSMH